MFSTFNASIKKGGGAVPEMKLSQEGIDEFLRQAFGNDGLGLPRASYSCQEGRLTLWLGFYPLRLPDPPGFPDRETVAKKIASKVGANVAVRAREGVIVRTGEEEGTREYCFVWVCDPETLLSEINRFQHALNEYDLRINARGDRGDFL